MEEKFMKAPSTHAFYKECFNYHTKDKVVFKKAKDYLKPYGVERKDVAVGYSDIGMIDKPKYREQFAGKYKMTDGYLMLKRNMKPGSGWKLNRPARPCLCFELNAIGPGSGRFYESKFIFSNTLYARIRGYGANIPKGFTEIPGSEFYLLVERINKEKLDHICI